MEESARMILRVAILTASDRSSRGERPDTSGEEITRIVTEQGWQVKHTAILPDDLLALQTALSEWCDSSQYDLVLTTGGTGFSPRDVTPEATRAIIEREAPGMAEAMRLDSLKVTPHAMLSRAVCGIRKRTLIANLPGSPKGAVENLRVLIPVLPHAVELLREDPHAEAGHLAPLDHPSGS
jgi:molybdenum cofactor synthesis domain-containing protein